MKGKNTLRLNEATIIEAVQEYMDARWTGEKAVVTSVKYSNTGYNDAAFEVTLDTTPEGSVEKST